jgi:hypothetical protein
MKLNELYIHFLIWLGAAPPAGYKYLLPNEKKKFIRPSKQIEAINPSPIKANQEGWVTEEDLPDWLKEGSGKR